MIESLQGKQLKNLFIWGANSLFEREEYINNLNVFPVPDGDTGTNMKLTLVAALEALKELPQDQVSATVVVKIIKESTLKGARGNSGVILSQLFRGFALGVGDTDVLTPADFSRGLVAGVTAAYRAVMRPVEGTILTVAREVSRAATKSADSECGYLDYFKTICTAARIALEDTPRLLPVLREAGVVDAGGMGLLCLYKGYYDYMERVWNNLGDSIPEDIMVPIISSPPVHARVVELPQETVGGYCTELLIKGAGLSPETLKQELQLFGDSLMVVGEGDLVKIHIHTEQPGAVLTACQGRGTLHDIKIDNMQDQHRHRVDGIEVSEGGSAGEEVAIGTLAVSSGAGLDEIFSSIGATAVIPGGQSMNTSANDFLQAIKKIPSRKIIILPNNKNILLAAQQAVTLMPDRELRVIPTKSIPEGLSVLAQVNLQEKSLEKIIKQAERILSTVKSGQVTEAVRDASINGLDITTGDWLGMADEDRLVIASNKKQALVDLVEKMVDSGDEIISIYYGQQVTAQEADQVKKSLSGRHPELQVELYFGGQPLYPYLVGVE
ncbi:MAG: DAK2 domain-containing protein [Firmicutes bacterium]|nr:DAK2 domain-containing protein [Bacillota bacterium]